MKLKYELVSVNFCKLLIKLRERRQQQLFITCVKSKTHTRLRPNRHMTKLLS